LLSGVLVAGALASGCATQKAATSQQSQGAPATVAGQLHDGADSSVAIVPHAFAGTVIGGSIAPNMDSQDLHVAGLALTDAGTQQPTRWHNADTGFEYVLVPTATFQGPDGPCRKFSMVASRNGSPQFADGIACRQPDGRWLVTR
jgi:surface antigen